MKRVVFLFTSLIREISLSGVVTILASTGSSGGNISTATFNNPIGIAVDSSGNVFIADFGNNLIRKITQ